MALRQLALQARCSADPHEKVSLAAALGTQAATMPVAAHAPASTRALPGRPARPNLNHPARVPRRAPGTPAGMAAPC